MKNNIAAGLALAVLIATAAAAMAAPARNDAPVPPRKHAAAKSKADSKSIKILGTTLVLKEEKKTETQYLAEYLPAIETFDDFTKMFAVWGYLDGTNAVAQAKAKIQFVNARKATDPVANYKLYQTEDKRSIGLDFLISEGGVMEQNVWYFTDVKGGALSYQYARRRYEGKSPQSAVDFINETPEVASKVLTYFKNKALPRPEGYGK